MAKPADPVESNEPDEAAEAIPAGKSKKKLFVILGLLVLLLGGGGGAAWFLTQDKGSAEHEEEAAPAETPIFHALETFTVNLQEGDQYLQVDITLQMTDPAQLEAIKLHMPRIRSRLLNLLSSKYADELVTPEDKQKLAQEVLAEVNQPFDPKGKPQQVKDVLFTSFVIQ